MKSAEDFTVWMNVSTSAAWSRPPVGIVRVEKEVALALERMFGKLKLKRCIWQDGEFVEWVQHTDSDNQSPLISAAIDRILPNRPSFEQARKLLGDALRSRDNIELSANGEIEYDSIRMELRGDLRAGNGPKRGDILVSIGLDWDAPYVEHFYDLRVRKGLKIITCCYDLIPVLFPHYCVGDVAQKFKSYFATMTWGSDGVLCISDNTLRDYKGLCSQTGAPERRMVVIPLGDNVPLESEIAVSSEIQAILEKKFILFVSTIERRKNHEVLYRAYRILRERSPKLDLPLLVFVGMPGWGVGDLLKDIELDPLTKGAIVQLNNVSDGELALLYKGAYFCVYPSLYEGWGLPVAEALTAGKAVISSSRGSLPEVGGDLVVYADPWNPTEWADLLNRWFTDHLLVERAEARIRDQYRPRTWNQTAAVIAGLIEDLRTDLDPSTQVLYPGYQFNTLVGVPFGPSIKSVGSPGFLMYGPYFSLECGNHKWVVEYSVESQEAGSAMMELVVVGSKSPLWQGFLSWNEGGTGASQRAEFVVELATYVDAYELRVVIDTSVIHINKVTKSLL